MSAPRIILRYIALTGPKCDTARMDFNDGVNVIFGASNTGKSFTIKLLNFMFGGKKIPPEIDEREGYDAVWLGLTLPDANDVTLYRATAGGAYQMFEGLQIAKLPDNSGRKIHPVYDAANPANISTLLLAGLGLDGKKIVKNENGQKQTFTIRTIAPYLFVEEEAIIAELSPILSGDRQSATAEKNAFRLLLTGSDDSAIVPVLPQNIRKAQQEGQYELVQELIDGIDKELGDPAPEREQLAEQLEKLKLRLNEYQSALIERQNKLDAMIEERRGFSNTASEARDRYKETALTIERFKELDSVYMSDIERLDAIEEGGALLMARAGRPCPLCGSKVDPTSHPHGEAEIQLARSAAITELAKIKSERRNLQQTIGDMETETSDLDEFIKLTNQKVQSLQLSLEQELPKEARTRVDYEKIISLQSSVKHKLELYSQRDDFVVRLSQLSEKVPRGRGEDKLKMGIDGPTGHAFALKVQEVLEAWNFPNDPKVSFDNEVQDFRINGKARAANGKGVRAILHTASKLAVLLLCKDKGLPHPGFLVLDTPLLTYREPMQNTKHGELDDDEKVLKASTLQESFYNHLSSLKDIAQILILENSDPPPEVTKKLHIEVFTGKRGQGRFGFFPTVEG